MTREIEARLKLSAVDRTAQAFRSVGNRMRDVDRRAAEINARSSKLTAVAATAGARVAGVLAPVGIAAAAKAAFTDFAEVDRRLTRIGITADASAEAVGGIRGRLADMAQEAALPIGEVTSGLEDLVAQGRSLDEALAFLPSVAKTAAASGSEVKDIAATSSALADSLKISADRMQAAFDVLVAGGKAGKFELKDMSQYLPGLAPAAAAIGLQGEAGLKRLVAMLQVVRNQTGDASTAANYMQNVFQKMESEETVKKFEKFGVDLRKEMDKARKGGKDLTEVFIDLTRQALKGDLSKIPQLFGDMQVSAGMRALLSQPETLRKLQSALDNVDGTTLRDLDKVTRDAQSSLDRLSNSWDRFVVEVGRSVANTGLPEVLDAMSRAMDRWAKIKEAEAAKPGGGDEERIRQSVADGMDRDLAEEMVLGWRQSTKAKEEARVATQRRVAEEMPAARAALEQAERAAAAAREKADAAGGGLFGKRPLLAEREATVARQRLEDLADEGMRANGNAQRFAPNVDRAMLAAGEAQRFRPAPTPIPLPTPRPEEGADAIRPAMQGLVDELDRQGATAVERAQAIWGQIEAVFRRPLVLNLQPPRLPALDTGRAITGGTQAGGP